MLIQPLPPPRTCCCLEESSEPPCFLFVFLMLTEAIDDPVMRDVALVRTYEFLSEKYHGRPEILAELDHDFRKYLVSTDPESTADRSHEEWVSLRKGPASGRKDVENEKEDRL